MNVGGPARITPSGDFGLIGLAVMGQNLLLNVADHKEFNVVAFNRTVEKVDRFMSAEAKGLSTPRPPQLGRDGIANATAKSIKTSRELTPLRSSF